MTSINSKHLVLGDFGYLPVFTPDKVILFQFAREYATDPDWQAPQAPPYRVLLRKAAGLWWVYKHYERVHPETKKEIFDRRLQLLSNLKRKKKNPINVTNYLSTVSVLGYEENYKIMTRGRFGRGMMHVQRTMRSIPVARSYRAYEEREALKAPLYLPASIVDEAEALLAYQQDIILNAMKHTMRQLQMCLENYVKKNKLYVEKQMKRVPLSELQAAFDAQLTRSRHDAQEKIFKIDGISSEDLLAGTLELPPWVGYHFFFMNVVSKKDLTLFHMDKKIVVIKEGDEKIHRPLKVKQSTYSRVVNYAVKKKQKRRTSNNSYKSGLSTVSGMSTATTSLRSYGHKRMCETDNRKMLTSEHFCDLQGRKLFFQRVNKDITSRFENLDEDIENVHELVKMTLRLDSAVTIVSESTRPRKVTVSMGSLTWLHRVENRLRELTSISSRKLSRKERSELEALTYAKMRYEPTLRAIERVKKGEHGLSINSSWMAAIQTGKISPATVNALKNILNDNDSFVVDSGFSNIVLGARADKSMLRKKNNPMDRVYVTLNEARIYTALVTGCVTLLVTIFVIQIVAQSYDFEIDDVSEIAQGCC